jgi:hypothetical protein
MMELETAIQRTPMLVAAPAEAIFLEPSVAEDWFEAALTACSPLPRPVRNSWGEDEDVEDEVPEEDEESEEDDPDPFDDFDEDDFDDDFDDDFEEELEDEYEIEPADDGMLEGHPDAEDIDDVETGEDEPPVEFAEEE